MPPATTTSASPARISRAPRLTAFSALAQTLLTVNDETVAGRPAREPRLARRHLSLSGGEHHAHDQLIDRGRIGTGALEDLADHTRAEVDGGHRREPAAELAERRSRRGDDDGVSWHGRPPEPRMDGAGGGR